MAARNNDFTADFLHGQAQEQHEDRLREYEEQMMFEMECELGCVDDYYDRNDHDSVEDDDFSWLFDDPDSL